MTDSRAALTLCAFALTAACGGGETAPAAAPPPPSLALSPSPSPTPTRNDAAYLNQLRDQLPGNYAFLPDADLISLGVSMCQSIDRGVDRPALARAAEDNIGPVVTKILLDAATTHICPQHSNF